MNIKETQEKKNPFKVPEGYFENLTGQIMAQLSERVDVAPKKTISLWGRMQPWVYAAAMIAGVALVVKLFISSPEVPESSFNLTSSVDIEEFLQYYEDDLTYNVYHDEFYLEEDLFGNNE